MLSDILLKEAVVKAIVIRETYPIDKPFDAKTLSFFQDLFFWRRPDKFVLGDSKTSIIEGTILSRKFFIKELGRKSKRKERMLLFTFDNGYVWIAGLRKIISDDLLKEANREAREIIYAREVKTG